METGPGAGHPGAELLKPVRAGECLFLDRAPEEEFAAASKTSILTVATSTAELREIWLGRLCERGAAGRLETRQRRRGAHKNREVKRRPRVHYARRRRRPRAPRRHRVTRFTMRVLPALGAASVRWAGCAATDETERRRRRARRRWRRHPPTSPSWQPPPPPSPRRDDHARGWRPRRRSSTSRNSTTASTFKTRAQKGGGPPGLFVAALRLRHPHGATWHVRGTADLVFERGTAAAAARARRGGQVSRFKLFFVESAARSFLEVGPAPRPAQMPELEISVLFSTPPSRTTALGGASGHEPGRSISQRGDAQGATKLTPQ